MLSETRTLARPPPRQPFTAAVASTITSSRAAYIRAKCASVGRRLSDPYRDAVCTVETDGNPSTCARQTSGVQRQSTSDKQRQKSTNCTARVGVVSVCREDREERQLLRAWEEGG